MGGPIHAVGFLFNYRYSIISELNFTILDHYRADEERAVEEDYSSVLASIKTNNRKVTELVDNELYGT